MRILLPPSEGKTAPAGGPALDFEGLSYPELTAARRRVLEALIAVSKRDDAGEILGVGKRIMPEVVAQRDILGAPCAPARGVYTGVLYETAQLRSGDDVRIFSGLFGVTTGEDVIPTYRLSMNVSLPGIGSLKTFWRRQLAQSGFDETANMAQTTVDMRSGAYQVTTPRRDWWDLRVVDSRGKVITHAAKHYRGLLTRALLDAEHAREAMPDDATPIDVAQVAGTLGHVEVKHDGLRRHITLMLE